MQMLVGGAPRVSDLKSAVVNVIAVSSQSPPLSAQFSEVKVVCDGVSLAHLKPESPRTIFSL
jgi:hypothetical protein